MKQYTHVVRVAMITVMLLMTGGLLTHTHAQGQTCRDVEQITICGDQFDEFLATVNGGGFRLKGNVRIGQKGQPALVEVEDIGSIFDGSILDGSVTSASYFHFNQADPNTNTKDFLVGDIRMINDPTGLTLLGTSVIPVPNSNPLQVRVGRLFVDPVGGRIFNPAAGAVPIFATEGIVRNANIRLAFVTQVGALSFYAQGGSVSELAKVDGEFNLFERKFKSKIPITLKFADPADNPGLEITMQSEFDETGHLTKNSINAFKFNMGGLTLDAKDVTVKVPPATPSPEFTAGSVKVLKADNNSLPNLDKTDPNLIFALGNLKYKNGAWSLGSVAVPIKDWEVGPAFKMTNQTIGIINDQTAGASAQAFEIKSTMKFGAGSDASTLPVTIKIGRKLVGSVFKPFFSGGLQTISPKLGTMTFKLTGAEFISDPAVDFFGIKAASAELKWPANLGSAPAAGIADFRLGIDKNRKLVFHLGSGTIGLPPFENELFKGQLTATIGKVNDVIVITGTGTLNIKLAGNAGAGVVTQVIMRYSKDVDTAANNTTAVAASMDADGNVVQAAQPFEYQRVAATSISTCIAPLALQTPCPGTTPPPPPPGPKPFEFKLTGFSMKVAGFGLTITNPKGTGDGGFTTDAVGLSLPVGMLSSLGNSGSGITVNGFGISGAGVVAIQGGGFELAPITVGSVQFVGLKGNFVRKPDKSYEFTAAGKLPLPGIEPGSNTGGIGVSITVRLKPAGDFNGVGVVVEFGSPPLPPIPLGSTGMNLTKITGAFDLTNGSVTIGVTLTAQSKFAIPIGSASLPLVKAQGGVTMKFNPFVLQGNATLTVLIFNMASASVNIGAGQGFNGGNGMNAVVNVDAVIISGEFRMRVGKGVPSDPEKRRFAASATWILGIPANKYGTGRPPFNLGGIQVGLAGGVFTDKNKNPAGEATGVKGNICGPNGNLCVGFFLNLGANQNGGGFLDFTNLDKYVLIPAAAVRAAAAAGQPGYASVAMSAQQAQAAGMAVSADQIDSGAMILADTIPIEVTSNTTLVAGINYHTGSPVVSLKLPGGAILTKDTVVGPAQTYLSQSVAITDGGTNVFFTISGATPGTYQLIIDNAPAEYENASYTLNASPQISMTEPTCDGPNVTGITVTCHVPVNLAASATVQSAAQPASADVNSKVHVEWNSSDVDSPDATVSLGYVVDPGAADLIDFADVNVVVEDLPLGVGAYDLDFSQVGTGGYRPVVIIDDHQNGFIMATSETTITVVDLLPPAIPVGLASVPGAGELLVKWDQNGEQDLAGYQIGFGTENDVTKFLYTRLMGPKELITTTSSIVDAKLWGLVDDTTVFFGLRAYDTSGNYSDWTPLQSAKPWALSPLTWNPVPNGENAGNVEVAFEVPMDPASLENKLTVVGADKKPLEGEQYFLLNAAGDKIIGIGVDFEEDYDGQATALLTGGASGVKSEDGRTMGANYAWTFVIHHDADEVFIPSVAR